MKLRRLLHSVPTSIILIIVFVMFVTHSIVLFLYTQNHQSKQHSQARAVVIQQVMNTIHVARATPPKAVPEALAVLHEPNVKASVSDKPKWELKANELNYWMVNQLVPRDADEIKISLHLPYQQWLNIHATIHGPAWITQSFLLIAEAFVGIIILLYAWSIQRFTAPLKDFRAAAERLGVDLKPIELEEYEGPFIVRRTAEAMNTMQKRITDLLNDRTRMLAAISHDLRTPITRLKLRLDKIDDAEITEKSLQDLNEMDIMIGEILAFAGQTATQEDKKKIDLNSLAESICCELQDIGMPIEYHAPKKHIPLYGKPLALKRAITNLIQNAVKYGKKARVSLSVSKKIITLIVEDQGPGIPENELEKVFSPFYRCDRSRSRKIAGTGLGLAVTREVILAHQGEITLRNKKSGGLRAIIELKGS